MSDLPSEPVAPDTVLYRRVHPVHYKSLPDGTCRLRETAFKNPKNGNDMSVQLGDTLDRLGISPERVLDGYDNSWGLAEFQAQIVMEHEQDVERTPKQDDEAHGDVIGAKPTSRRRAFAEAAQWTVPPSREL